MSNFNQGGDWGDDGFTETTHKSWFQRIGDSIKGILVGLILVVGSSALLFWNEGRAAKTAAALSEGAGVVRSVANDRIDAANNGKLVHVAGDTSATSDVRDPQLGFAQKGLQLARKVEMYQWKEESRTETRQKVGGGEERVTTYRYVREWSDRRIDSGRFRRPGGHQNPAWPAAGSQTFAASDAKLGAFAIDNRIIGRLGGGERVDVPDSLGDTARRVYGERTSIRGGTIYAGDNPDTPRIGDLRVTYTLLPLQAVSVVAKQENSGFAPYVASNRRQVLLASTGTRDAADMFQSAQEANTLLTWGLRILGIFLMFSGFALILGPISVFASVIPLLGNIAGFGTSLIAAMATAIAAPVIIAIAWFFYRPLVAGLVLAAGVAIVFGLKHLGRKRRAVSRQLARDTSGA